MQTSALSSLARCASSLCSFDDKFKECAPFCLSLRASISADTSNCCEDTIATVASSKDRLRVLKYALSLTPLMCSEDLPYTLFNSLTVERPQIPSVGNATLAWNSIKARAVLGPYIPSKFPGSNPNEPTRYCSSDTSSPLNIGRLR